MRLIIQLTHTHHGVDPSHILHNTHCCCSVCNYAARGSCKTQRSAAAALTILIVLYLVPWWKALYQAGGGDGSLPSSGFSFV